MSPTTPAMSSGSSGFPRVSGDEPPHRGILWSASVFSPRERG